MGAMRAEAANQRRRSQTNGSGFSIANLQQWRGWNHMVYVEPARKEMEEIHCSQTPMREFGVSGMGREGSAAQRRGTFSSEATGALASLQEARSGSAPMVSAREVIEEIRFSETLLQAEELAIKKMRAAEVRSGGWALRIFGIGKAFGGMPGSKLVHPRSPFASSWLMISANLLLYSCLCSAFYVGFLWQTTLCDWPPPTLHFDMMVDLFFLLEIVLNFFTGVTIAGEYSDDMSKVTFRYLMNGGFILDLATSIPVSWVEWSLLMQCQAMAASGDEFDGGVLRIMRTNKALRLLRLLRLLKIIARLKNIMDLIAFIGDHLRIPPYVLRVIKILILIALLVHLCTCGWWLIKTETNPPHELNNWLADKDLDAAPTEDIASKYVIAFYFVNTVFCTIGFGDISGGNDAERLYCVLLYYLGVFVFGSLLVEVQDAVGQARLEGREREKEISQIVEFLRAENVPKKLARKMTKWADFGIRAMQRFEKRQKILDAAPEHLQRQLLGALHHGMLSTVPLFMRMDSVYREDLLLDFFAKMTPMVFNRHCAIAIPGFGTHCLYVIRSGSVILQRGNKVLATLHAGDSFDADWLLLDDVDQQVWDQVDNPGANEDCCQRATEHMRYIAVTDTMCMCLSKADFDQVVNTYDESIGAYFAAERTRILKGLPIRRTVSDNREEAALPSTEVCRSSECWPVYNFFPSKDFINIKKNLFFRRGKRRRNFSFFFLTS